MTVAPDGTPVADVLAENRELQAEVAELKRTLRTIRNICDAPHWTADRRWRIRDLTRTRAPGQDA